MGNNLSLPENDIITRNYDDDEDTPTDIYRTVSSTRMIPPPVYNAAGLEEGIVPTPGSGTTKKQNDDDDNDDEDESTNSDDLNENDINSTSAADGDDEDYYDRLNEETLQTERDSMIKRADEDDDIGRLGFDNSVSENEDEYEDWPLEFMQSYDRDTFFVRRHKTPSSMFVVAKRGTPLVIFCQHIYVLQLEEERTIRNLNPKSHPTTATDEEIVRSVPGILARVVSDVLHEPPQFVVPLDDGSSVRALGNDSDPIAERKEDIDIPLRVAPIQILDPVDADYEERIAAAKRMQSSNSSQNLLQKIDDKVNHNQLKNFVTTGNRLPFDTAASPGYTETSPVQEGEEWFIINKQYYFMWKAFERTCWGNGNFLIDVNTRLSSTPDNTYFFGVDMEQSTVNNYSAQQEHRVLEKILTMYKRTVHLEASISNKYAVIRNLCDAACAKLDEVSLRHVSVAVGAEATNDQSEALKNISDAASLLRSLETIQRELDELRKARSFLMQENKQN